MIKHLKTLGVVGLAATLGFAIHAAPAKADVAEAKRIVADAMAPPLSFAAPGPAFDAKKATGKSLWYISFSEQSPIMATWSGTMKRLVEGYGAKVNIVDGKSNFSEFGRLIEQAVANRASAILLMGIPPQAFGVQVQEAKDAGIPVIVGSNGATGIPDMNGVVAAATIDHVKVGKMLAAWMVADSNGKGEAAIVTHDEVMGTKEIVDSFKGEVDRLCSQCKVTVENLPFARIQTEGEVTQSLAARNPNLGYIIPVYDFETLTMAPALEAAGAADRVKLASFNAIQPVMENLKGGKVAADVGSANVWFGFAMADQVLRVLSGVPPVADIKVPLRLFNKDNIGTVDVMGDSSEWYGNVDFPSAFQKLWGQPNS